MPLPAAVNVDFSGITLPFGVADMLSTATSFLGIYGPWILLVLGVIFSPVLYGLVMKLISYAAKKNQVKA
ncbi:hypothetical protein [Paenibacillus macerans]|uniref:hypothetical protein n=1 Tax=Paenibacillus macerans TaxID=44252 RepID=UPI000EDFBB30|nr:hypothetical protein [Paenibacillus macerans]GBK66262.1 hypothetical protein PbDSM24746_62660 [Paenibacillus macerans]GBK72571.1 hypothetical protein PbJCM17693_62790 [Paenibacillus macerans]